MVDYKRRAERRREFYEKIVSFLSWNNMIKFKKIPPQKSRAYCLDIWQLAWTSVHAHVPYDPEVKIDSALGWWLNFYIEENIEKSSSPKAYTFY
jgi:hypothetical protein